MGVWGGVGVGLDFFERLGLIFEQKMCLILEKELGEKFKWCSLEKLKKLCHENQKLTWSLKVKSSIEIFIKKFGLDFDLEKFDVSKTTWYSKSGSPKSLKGHPYQYHGVIFRGAHFLIST